MLTRSPRDLHRARNRERDARRRERKRLGRFIVPVETDYATADALVEAGFLPQWDAEDRKAIGRAIERLLDALLVEDDRG
jgi:hypothetical protein